MRSRRRSSVLLGADSFASLGVCRSYSVLLVVNAHDLVDVFLTI